MIHLFINREKECELLIIYKKYRFIKSEEMVDKASIWIKIRQLL